MFTSLGRYRGRVKIFSVNEIESVTRGEYGRASSLMNFFFFCDMFTSHK